MQRIGNFLHGERIGRSARPDPQQVDAAFPSRRDMLARGDFGCDVHARFAFHAPQPREPFGADPLETARFGAGFPQTGAEDAESGGSQPTGRCERLFFGFGTARPGDDRRTVRLDIGKERGAGIFHGLQKYEKNPPVFPIYSRVFPIFVRKYRTHPAAESQSTDSKHVGQVFPHFLLTVIFAAENALWDFFH